MSQHHEDLVPVLPAGVSVVTGCYFPDPKEAPRLGPCCACGGKFGVRAIFSIDRRSPAKGGWGCVVCDMSGGALVAVCDLCLADGRPVRWGCLSFPGDGGRAPIELFTEPFGHNLAKHPEVQSQEVRRV